MPRKLGRYVVWVGRAKQGEEVKTQPWPSFLKDKWFSKSEECFPPAVLHKVLALELVVTSPERIRSLHLNVSQLYLSILFSWHLSHSKAFWMKEAVCWFAFRCYRLISLLTSNTQFTDQNLYMNDIFDRTSLEEIPKCMWFKLVATVHNQEELQIWITLVLCRSQ